LKCPAGKARNPKGYQEDFEFLQRSQAASIGIQNMKLFIREPLASSQADVKFVLTQIKGNSYSIDLTTGVVCRY
jgi:hypothetical protein